MSMDSRSNEAVFDAVSRAECHDEIRRSSARASVPETPILAGFP